MFLLVEDCPVAAKQVVAVLRRYGEFTVAGSLEDARRELGRHTHLLGLLVDVSLPDGNGLDWLQTVRPERPNLPVLVLTASEDRPTVQMAQLLGAEYLPKPAPPPNLAAFAARCVEHRRSSKEKLDVLLEELVQSHGLSPREGEVIAHVAHGMAPADLADTMAVSENTVKTLTRRALRKCNALRLVDVVRPLQLSVWDAATQERTGAQ